MYILTYCIFFHQNKSLLYMEIFYIDNVIQYALNMIQFEVSINRAVRLFWRLPRLASWTIYKRYGI